MSRSDITSLYYKTVACLFFVISEVIVSRSDITSDGYYFCFDIYFAVIAFSNYFLCL